jgi:hypothetical protein
VSRLIDGVRRTVSDECLCFVCLLNSRTAPVLSGYLCTFKAEGGERFSSV